MGLTVVARGGNQGDGRSLLLIQDYSAVIAGTWTPDTTNNNINNSSSADGDEINWQTFISAGTYTLLCTGISSSDRPKVDIYIGSLKAVSGDDWYSAGATSNVRKTTTGISVTTSGATTIRLVVNGKNGASSNYRVYMNSICLWRTS